MLVVIATEFKFRMLSTCWLLTFSQSLCWVTSQVIKRIISLLDLLHPGELITSLLPWVGGLGITCRAERWTVLCSLTHPDITIIITGQLHSALAQDHTASTRQVTTLRM